MEPIDLDRLEALEKAATPAPWGWYDVKWSSAGARLPQDFDFIREHPDRFNSLSLESEGGKYGNVLSVVLPGGIPSSEDGELLTALRNAAPALLSEARAAARMRKAATALLAYFDRCGAPAYEHMEALRASLGGEDGKEGA
jgi:hypothetical protein